MKIDNIPTAKQWAKAVNVYKALINTGIINFPEQSTLQDSDIVGMIAELLDNE